MLTEVPKTGWTVPLRGDAATAPRAVELDAFLRVIRAEEDRLTAREGRDTRRMVTRLRKLFYGGRGWDEYLIAGAAGVPALHAFTMAEPVRREVEVPGPNVLRFVDARPRLEGAPAALVHPGDLQEVRMPDGEIVDVGHVLAGLDAINHPAAVVAPFGMYEVTSNVDAVTWLGDLGSVLGELLFQGVRLDRPLTDAEVRAQIDLCAPPQDMLGNVDAYAIADAYDVSGATEARVSDILLDYYAEPAVAGTARAARFETFAQRVGLGRLQDGAFAAEPPWLERYEREVGHAAALYVGAMSELASWSLPYALGAKLALMQAARDAPLRRTLLERFVASLRLEAQRRLAPRG